MHVLNTLASFVQCSSVVSAHLAGLGVAVDLLWILSATTGIHEHRVTACRILSLVRCTHNLK